MVVRYCVTHEEWLIAGSLQHFDELEAHSDCWFTTSAPEPLPENWEMLVREPSAEELEQMNLDAVNVMLDLVG